MIQTIQSLDAEVLLYIQTHLRCGFLNAVMYLLSLFCYFGIPALILALFIVRRTRFCGTAVTLSVLAALAVSNLILKTAVARPRPFLTIPELELIISPLESFSFPSSHAASSFACAVSVCISSGSRWKYASLPAAMLISFSRLYFGVHYPSDILAGALLGAMCAAVCSFAVRYIRPRMRR